ncbi:myosin-G heavy chain-like [Octopus vulgaris]|uniref:Myosin-G heavy chain-like n=1 Tax=Octopus vulgaris TaxID=6645 RepID=A0AA36B703_OCTVU|nr:myosin-G heavy chain-like [Octopus vulgaris]
MIVHRVHFTNKDKNTRGHDLNSKSKMSVVSTSPNSSYPPVKEPNNLMCRYCAMQFDTEDELNAHVLSHSRGAAPLKCTLCGQTYRTSSKLQRHIRVHSGEKPYICHICGRRFSRSDHLKQHSKVHSNHRTKNTCRICNARFVASHLLKSHLRSHGIKSVQTCETCGEAFETCIELEKHQKLHEVKQSTVAKVRRKNSLTPEEVSNGDTETTTEEPPVIEGAKWTGCARFCLVSSQPAENETSTYSIETVENSEKGWMQILGQLAEADYAEHNAAKSENLNETVVNYDVSQKSSTIHSTNLEENNNQMLETKEISDQINDSSTKSPSPLLTIQESANDDDDFVDEEEEEEDNEHSEEIIKSSTIKHEPGGDIEEEEEGGENDDEEGEEDIEPNCDELSCDERMEVIEASEEFSDDESTNTALKVCYSLVGSGEEFENIEAETITDGTKMFVVPSTSDFEKNDQEEDISDNIRNGEVDFDNQQISYTISLVDKQPLESDQTANNSRTGPFQIGNKKISNCKHCGIWFEDFAIYMLHNSLHLGNDDPFTCKKCLKKLDYSILNEFF